MFPDNANFEAPFEFTVLVTIYSNITILPSDNFLPVTPSPKYTSYLLFEPSCMK